MSESNRESKRDSTWRDRLRRAVRDLPTGRRSEGESARGPAPQPAWLPLFGHVGEEMAVNDEMTDAALAASLRLQLADVDEVPTLSNLTHVRAFAPGLVELLVVTTPERVIAPPADELAHLGTPEELVEMGRENLLDTLAHVGQEIEVRTFEAEEGLTFTGLLGESLAVASLAIVLPRLVTLLHPGVPTDKGVFVAVPNANHLAFRIADDMTSLMAVGPMSVFARNGYEDAGATSPHVYWAHGPDLADFTPLTTHSADHIAIHVPGDLSELLER